VVAALAAIPIRPKMAGRPRAWPFSAAQSAPRSIKICARSYLWVGERIEQVLRAVSSGSIDQAFTTIRIELRRIASQEPIEGWRTR